MRNYHLIIALIISLGLNAQGKYLTKTGTVNFEASVPAFEEIKASNTNTTAIINTDNGEFAALVLVKGFRFKNALMEEHFNENYAESDDYPKATFRGVINDFSMNDIDEGSNFKYSGSITFHGKTKALENENISIKKLNDGSLNFTGDLKVNVADFDIEIPKIVSNKLSREVSITFDFKLSKK